jgi:hypothetical protein
MTAIGRLYDEYHNNKQEFGRRMEVVRREISDAYTKGKVSESNYKILNDKISEYKDDQ